MNHQKLFAIMLTLYLFQVYNINNYSFDYFKNMMITFGIIGYMDLLKLPIIVHEVN